MRRHIIVIITIAWLVVGAIEPSSVKRYTTARITPGSYIVTLTQETHVKRGFVSPHAELYHDLKIRSTSYEAIKEWNDPGLLIGALVKLGGGADLEELAQAPSVESINPVRRYILPKPTTRRVVGPSNTTVTRDTLSTHVLTGVDKLHAEGYFGQGIKIGIIDSGIDYTHPALGGGFGPGNKVIGGYDFVGDEYTGFDDSPDPQPDNDPLDQCDGHGTHVAGVIGANPNNPYNISGVAYKSEINAYRVFGCSGVTTEDIVIDALLRAYKDGNDVINLSLGGPGGWAQDVSSAVASRIADRGRVVTIAEGNDGQYGSWYSSSPASGLSVISVGSIENTIFEAQNATASNGRQITYSSLTALPIPAGLSLYATANDTNATSDACEALSATTPDLSNKLVLIRRGNCTFIQKFDNASKFGARYFLVYDNVDRPLSGISPGNYTAALISQADGRYLVTEGIAQNLTLSFTDNPYTYRVPGGGLMSNYSTYGPTNDMHLKPAVVAPGGNILSTVPRLLGLYAVLSGTSFAAPFAAGSAALLLQTKGKTARNAKAVRAMLQNTATPLKRATMDTNLFETATHQGAGLIQVYNAVHTTSSMRPSELLLNDTAYYDGTRKIKINNSGKTDVTYRLGHISAGTALTINGIEPIPGPVPLISSDASVTISPGVVTVRAGQTRSISLRFQPPIGLDPKTFPVYSGFIIANGSDGPSLQSTYLGVAAELKEAKIIDNTNAYFGDKLPFVANQNNNPISGPATFTLNGTDIPLLIYRLVFGTPHLRVDLIDSNQSVEANQRRSFEVPHYLDALNHLPPAKRSFSDWLLLGKKGRGETFARVKTRGIIYQETYLPRNTGASTIDANGFSGIVVSQFTNGTAIPNGAYRVLLRALRISGNPKNEEDYEVWTSQTIYIKRI